MWIWAPCWGWCRSGFRVRWVAGRARGRDSRGRPSSKTWKWSRSRPGAGRPLSVAVTLSRTRSVLGRKTCWAPAVTASASRSSAPVVNAAILPAIGGPAPSRRDHARHFQARGRDERVRPSVGHLVTREQHAGKILKRLRQVLSGQDDLVTPAALDRHAVGDQRALTPFPVGAAAGAWICRTMVQQPRPGALRARPAPAGSWPC